MFRAPPRHKLHAFPGGKLKGFQVGARALCTCSEASRLAPSGAASFPRGRRRRSREDAPGPLRNLHSHRPPGKDCQVTGFSRVPLAAPPRPALIGAPLKTTPLLIGCSSLQQSSRNSELRHLLFNLQCAGGGEGRGEGGAADASS